MTYDITQYMADKAKGDIYLARYLLTMADKRGLTHGEKHYIIQTAIKLLVQAGDELGDTQQRLTLGEVSGIGSSDIPF